MNYEAKITLSVSSPDSAEEVTKRFRAVLEFGTVREVIGDALDLETDYHLIDVALTSSTAVETH